MIKNSDGMPKKCSSKSLFFFIFFSPGFAPYFRMSADAIQMRGIHKNEQKTIR